MVGLGVAWVGLEEGAGWGSGEVEGGERERVEAVEGEAVEQHHTTPSHTHSKTFPWRQQWNTPDTCLTCG